MKQEKISKSNNPDKAIDRQDKVQSNDRKMKQDFPGYPHYPASEDILNPQNNNGRAPLTSENDTTATGTESVRGEAPTEGDNEVEDELGIVEGTEADVDEDDLEILRSSDRGMAMHSEDPQELDMNLDVTGDDLDIPGSELDDENEELGEEDEENNYYSLGGDNHDNLEEDRGQ